MLKILSIIGIQNNISGRYGLGDKMIDKQQWLCWLVSTIKGR